MFGLPGPGREDRGRPPRSFWSSNLKDVGTTAQSQSCRQRHGLHLMQDGGLEWAIWWHPNAATFHHCLLATWLIQEVNEGWKPFGKAESNGSIAENRPVSKLDRAEPVAYVTTIFQSVISFGDRGFAAHTPRGVPTCPAVFWTGSMHQVTSRH